MKLKPGQYSTIITVVNPANRQALGYRLVKGFERACGAAGAIRSASAAGHSFTTSRPPEQLLKAAYYEVLRDSAKVENFYAKKILDSNGIEK